MKLKSSNNQYQSTVTGKKIAMGFAADAASHLAELMSNSVYQDKYGSIVREVVSNAVDANVESGSTRKVEVSVIEKPSMSDGVGFLDVTDYGLGISPERIENIFTQYFASTKRDTNDQIGGFGIGAKSPFAYTPVFTVITRTDGVQRTYLMEKTTGDRTCTLISQVEDSNFISGTTIRIPIQDMYDEAKFIKAISNQLILLSDRLIINIPSRHFFYMPKVIDFGDIFCIEMEDGTYMEHEGVMLSLGDILYKIPHKDKNGYCPVNYVLKFDIGEISPTLSREGIEMNDEADILIHNKAHAVTNLIEEKWIPEQTKPSTSLKKLVGSRDKQGPLFPGTEVPVLHYNNQYDMARKFTVKTAADNWPKSMDFWKFNQIIQSIFNISHKYSNGKNKFTTPSGIALMRDVIRKDGYEKYKVIIKNSEDVVGTIYKEWFVEMQPLGQHDVAFVSIDTDIRKHLNLIYEKELKPYRVSGEAQDLLDQMENLLIRSINDWLKGTPRVKHHQPSEAWLLVRKEKRNTQKTTKWTKDALLEECPVRIVTDGYPKRGALTYEEIKKPGNVVIANKIFKELHIPKDQAQPVTFIVVSETNYKRCQAAGAHCWTLDDVHKVKTRGNRQAVEDRIREVIKRHKRNEYNEATRAIFNCGKSVHKSLLTSNRPRKAGKLVHLQEMYTYGTDDECIEKLMEKDQILHDSRIYSANKDKLISRNFEKIMSRTPSNRLIMAILGPMRYNNHNNLYTDLLHSLNLNTHD